MAKGEPSTTHSSGTRYRRVVANLEVKDAIRCSSRESARALVKTFYLSPNLEAPTRVTLLVEEVGG